MKRQIHFKASSEYIAWLVGFSRSLGVPVAELVGQAVAELARRRKHEPPPERVTPSGWSRSAKDL